MTPRALPDVRRRVLETFRWTGAGTADPSAWWRDADLLAGLGPALAELHPDAAPTVVAAIEARGFIPAALVAGQLGVGLAAIRKGEQPGDADDPPALRETEPDYRGRQTVLSLRRHVIGPGDRVLLVDDWLETGAQARAVQTLVLEVGGVWVGAAAIVDELPEDIRTALNARGLVRGTELPW